MRLYTNFWAENAVTAQNIRQPASFGKWGGCYPRDPEDYAERQAGSGRQMRLLFTSTFHFKPDDSTYTDDRLGLLSKMPQNVLGQAEGCP